MTRKEHVKWCEKCVNREYSLNGLLCSLTHEYADFEISCNDFHVDKKEALLVDRKYIFNKYGDKLNSEIRLTKLRPQIEWFRKLDLPKQLIIRKQSSKPWYYTFLILCSCLFIVVFKVYFFDNKTSTFLLVSMFSILGIIAFLLYQIRIYKRDETPIITMNKNGIILGENINFFWEEIQTFQLNEHSLISKEENIFLIIKPLINNEVKVNISHLEYSPNEINHYIEKYKLALKTKS